jgi:hypothetical protein
VSALTPQFILRHDCDTPHCSDAPRERRARMIDVLGYAPDYAHGQGYTLATGKRGILFGNWNEFSARAGNLLERAGWELEWEDQWTTCDYCGKAVRTSPNSYSWQPAYIKHDGNIYCQECADVDAYLADLQDDASRACFDWIDPSEHGYVLLQGEYENGLHPGQNDDPAKILAALHATGRRGIVFRVIGTGQFDTTFEAWQVDNGAESGG